MKTDQTKRNANRILKTYGARLEMSREDGSYATDRALPTGAAALALAELLGAGIEASPANDHDDRGLVWIHVTT